MSGDDAVIVALKLALATFLLWVASLFSASETALLGVGKVKAKHLADEGNESAKQVLRLYRNPPRLIATLIAGITIADYIAEALVTSVALDLNKTLQFAGLSAILSVAFAFFVLTFIDVMPAIYGASYADIVAFSVARWVAFFQKLFAPVLVFVEWVVGSILSLLGLKDAHHPPLVTEAEIFATLDIAEQQGVITKEQKQMLASALEFKEVAGTPSYRLGLALLDLDDPSKLIARCRYPVFSPNADYERVGNGLNIVFTCGTLVRGDEVWMYYGAADTCIGLAVAKLSELLDAVRNDRF
jgi:Mg2+/Co2+ transporter CorB